MLEVAEAMTAIREGLSTPRGPLRVASPMLFSQLAMGRISAEFRVAYPEVTLEVVAEDRLAKDRMVVVAAPSVPMPSPGSIAPVPGIVFSNFQPTHWRLDDGRLVLEPIPKLRLSSFLMIRDAAVAGAGAALIPQSIAWSQLTRGELVQWGTVSGVEVELWVLHTSRRLPAPKVRAFVEFMCDRYPEVSLALKG
jgi:DNA-binding transcriptional LysR family regulator